MVQAFRFLYKAFPNRPLIRIRKCNASVSCPWLAKGAAAVPLAPAAEGGSIPFLQPTPLYTPRCEQELLLQSVHLFRAFESSPHCLPYRLAFLAIDITPSSCPSVRQMGRLCIHNVGNSAHTFTWHTREKGISCKHWVKKEQQNSDFPSPVHKRQQLRSRQPGRSCFCVHVFFCVIVCAWNSCSSHHESAGDSMKRVAPKQKREKEANDVKMKKRAHDVHLHRFYGIVLLFSGSSLTDLSCDDERWDFVDRHCHWTMDVVKKGQ